MSELVILRGLPASGKTVFAAGLVVTKGYKRVSLSDLRASIDNNIYTKSAEQYLVKVMEVMIESAAKRGYNVVLDNLNLNPIHLNWAKEQGKKSNMQIRVVEFFDVTVEECIQRDLDRNSGRVGKEIIMGLYDSYVRNING